MQSQSQGGSAGGRCPGRRTGPRAAAYTRGRPADRGSERSEPPSPSCNAFAVLTPENEVRPPNTADPVDSQARGFAHVKIKGTTLKFTVVIFNFAGETFIAGHIHVGEAGENGDVVVPLFVEDSSDRRVFVQSDKLEIDANLAADICGDLAGYYVNYHTTLDPQGAVRGQLTGF
jgi:hypothetical protein